jgi:hypothetical protein
MKPNLTMPNTLCYPNLSTEVQGGGRIHMYRSVSFIKKVGLAFNPPPGRLGVLNSSDVHPTTDISRGAL